MRVTYVMSEEEADVFHTLLDLKPEAERFVGICGKKLYTTKVTTDVQTDVLITNSYPPVCYSLSIDYLSFSSEENSSIVEIVKGLYKKYAIDLSNVEVVSRQGFTLYYPKYKGDYIYENLPEDFLTLDIFVGRKFLSESSLALLYEEREFYGVKEEHGIITCDDVSVYHLDPDNIRARLRRMKDFVDNKKEEGYVVIDDCPICLEFSMIWNLSKRLSPGLSVYKPKERITDFSNWMISSVQRIKEGRTPLWKIRGDDLQAAEDAFEILLKSNYWLITEKKMLNVIDGIVTFPVLSKEDVDLFVKTYDSFSRGSSVDDVDELAPLDVEGEVTKNTVVTPDGMTRKIKGVTEESWRYGDHLSPWGGYFLQKRGIYSAALTI